MPKWRSDRCSLWPWLLRAVQNRQRIELAGGARGEHLHGDQDLVEAVEVHVRRGDAVTTAARHNHHSNLAAPPGNTRERRPGRTRLGRSSAWERPPGDAEPMNRTRPVVVGTGRSVRENRRQRTEEKEAQLAWWSSPSAVVHTTQRQRELSSLLICKYATPHRKEKKAPTSLLIHAASCLGRGRTACRANNCLGRRNDGQGKGGHRP